MMGTHNLRAKKSHHTANAVNTANWHQWWWGTHNVKCKDVTMQQTHQMEWIGFNGGGGPQLKCKKVTTQQISFSGDGDSQLKCNKVNMQWTQWIGINSERSECSKFASLVVGTQNVSTKKSTHIKFQPCSNFGHAVNAQGSHWSGNSGKILKTFSSQGNQGKTGVFQPKSGKKISNQGTFFSKPFSNLLNL